MQYRKILETGPDKEAPPGGLDAPGRWDHCLKGSRSRWPLTFRGGIPRKLGSFDLKMAILNSLPISSSLSRGFCIYSRSCARMSLYWSLMAQVHVCILLASLSPSLCPTFQAGMPKRRGGQWILHSSQSSWHHRSLLALRLSFSIESVFSHPSSGYFCS